MPFLSRNLSLYCGVNMPKEKKTGHEGHNCVPMKRKETIPNNCSRCGSDLLGGRVIWILPYSKVYICFCYVCAKGLGIDGFYSAKKLSDDDWKNFWNQEIMVNKSDK